MRQARIYGSSAALVSLLQRLAVAENQVAAYLGLVADGAIFGLWESSRECPWGGPDRAIVGRFTGESLRKSLSQRASVVVDGGGRVRVVDASRIPDELVGHAAELDLDVLGGFTDR